eukprot:gene14923-17639_t
MISSESDGEFETFTLNGAVERIILDGYRLAPEGILWESTLLEMGAEAGDLQMEFIPYQHYSGGCMIHFLARKISAEDAWHTTDARFPPSVQMAPARENAPQIGSHWATQLNKSESMSDSDPTLSVAPPVNMASPAHIIESDESRKVEKAACTTGNRQLPDPGLSKSQDSHSSLVFGENPGDTKPPLVTSDPAAQQASAALPGAKELPVSLELALGAFQSKMERLQQLEQDAMAWKMKEEQLELQVRGLQHQIASYEKLLHAGHSAALQPRAAGGAVNPPSESKQSFREESAMHPLGKRKADSMKEMIDLLPGAAYISEGAMTQEQRHRLGMTSGGQKALLRPSYTVSNAAQRVLEEKGPQVWKMSSLLPYFVDKAALNRFVLEAVNNDGDGQVEVGLIQDTSDPCFNGFGMFAVRDLEPWELKLGYLGECKTNEEFEHEVDKDASNELEHLYTVDLECTRQWGGQDMQLVVDAWCTAGRGRYINDHRNDLTSMQEDEEEMNEEYQDGSGLPRRHQNAYFLEVVVDGIPRILVVNYRSISAGEQLLVEYGDAFVAGLQGATTRTQHLKQASLALVKKTRIQVKKEFGIF